MEQKAFRQVEIALLGIHHHLLQSPVEQAFQVRRRMIYSLKMPKKNEAILRLKSSVLKHFETLQILRFKIQDKVMGSIVHQGNKPTSIFQNYWSLSQAIVAVRKAAISISSFLLNR